MFVFPLGMFVVNAHQFSGDLLAGDDKQGLKASLLGTMGSHLLSNQTTESHSLSHRK